MAPPHSIPHSARPSRSPSPTSGPDLPLQTLINTPAITTTSTPRPGITTGSAAGGGPAIVHHPLATSESRQSLSQSQLSKAVPFLSPGLATRPTSTLPSSAFRFPSERLTRARSRTVSSLETQSQRKFGSTSSWGMTGSDSGVHRASRGRSRQGGLAAQDARSNNVANNEQPGTSTLPTPQNPVPPSEQKIPLKGFPWHRVILVAFSFLVMVNLPLTLPNPGWWDFEGRASRIAASATLSVCVLCLKLLLSSHLWSPGEGIQEGESSIPTTVRLQIANEGVEPSSKVTSASARLNNFSLVCTPEKPHSHPNCLQSTPLGDTLHASRTTATNNPESRQVTVHQTQATGAPPLPCPSPSSSDPTWSEFRFLSAEPSFRGWVSEPKGKPDRCGGYSDVWKCRIRFCEQTDLHPVEVAVKVLREVDLNQFGNDESHRRILARFQQEAITWSGLAHPNIVPLIGYTLIPSLGFISPWYKQGSLRQYLDENSNVDRLELLHGIAKALDFLHSRTPRIAHGDIKPENILIDEQNKPRLGDFGLATILGEEYMYTVSHQQAGTWRWMAPEQILGGSRSCESDTYSFGSLAFWVMTSDLPFASLRNNEIIIAVHDQTKPVSPVPDWNKYPELERSLKDIVQHCWCLVPRERLSMSVVEERLAARG